MAEATTILWVTLVVASINVIAFAVAGYLMLAPVDRAGDGIALGVLLGPMGLVIAWIIRDNEYREREEYQRRHWPK